MSNILVLTTQMLIDRSVINKDGNNLNARQGNDGRENMGLDMYLTAKRSYWDFSKEDKSVKKKLTTTAGLDDSKFDVKGISIEAGYWRKANAIHKWFVDHVQDGVDECQEHYVETEQLEELRDACKAVLKDTDKAEVLLPPHSGFFFGGTAIDEYYKEDLKDTIKIVDDILEFCGDDYNWSISYRSSW